MSKRTLPGQKLQAAKFWCEHNRDLLPPHTKFTLMYPETLYAYLSSIGVAWSSKGKYWYKVGSPADPLKGRRGPWSAGVPFAKRVSVRITAVHDVMDEILAEFTELCEALDWHVKVSPKRYPNGSDGQERVYIEVDRTRS